MAVNAIGNRVLDDLVLPATVTEFVQFGRVDTGTGFAAEEVSEVDPILATYDEQGRPESVRYRQLTALLTNQDCEDSELFARTSENLYKLEPSSQAAYNLARLFFRKEEFDKSVSYYEEAIESEQDLQLKSKYQYELGLIQFSKYDDYPKARTLARSAAENNPTWGEPYILIGNLYASSSIRCGDNEFEKSTVFWAAVDKYIKAKTVDPSCNEDATELINKYSQYFPNVEDAFFYGFENGQPYTVGCWINESTTVRARQIP